MGHKYSDLSELLLQCTRARANTTPNPSVCGLGIKTSCTHVPLCIVETITPELALIPQT